MPDNKSWILAARFAEAGEQFLNHCASQGGAPDISAGSLSPLLRQPRELL